MIHTDPRLLEQMLRNLVANALKYTDRGRVLLGCRRHGSTLRIEVWDTGIGIADSALQAVFDEYHQIGNDARERERGLGLGLSIVQRLGGILGHRVTVRSRPGKGSVFIIEVPCVVEAVRPAHSRPRASAIEYSGRPAPSLSRPTRHVLVIEDDPDLRHLLRQILLVESYRVEDASSGHAAVDKLAAGSFRPDLVVADYNLPGGMTGLQAAARLRESLPDLPVIILTGDISTATLQEVRHAGAVQLNKPVRPHELIGTIEDLLSHDPTDGRATKPIGVPDARPGAPVVFVVDDDRSVRVALRAVLEDDGRVVEDYAGSDAFLTAFKNGHPGRNACLLVDAAMPGIGGLELLEK